MLRTFTSQYFKSLQHPTSAMASWQPLYVPFNGITDIPKCVAPGNDGDRGEKAPQSVNGVIGLLLYWLFNNFLSLLWGIPMLASRLFGRLASAELGLDLDSPHSSIKTCVSKHSVTA